MYKFTYFLLALPTIGLLTPTLLGSPVPDHGDPFHNPTGRPQPNRAATIEHIRLTGEAAAEFMRRLDAADVAIPLTGGNGNTPPMQFTPEQDTVPAQPQQEVQWNQGVPPVQPEGQPGDVLAEIREASVVTEVMQTRFWDYVRQDELTPNDYQAIQGLIEALPQAKIKKLINDYILGNEMSFDVEAVDGRGVATTTLKHSVFPRLFRLGHSDLAMGLLVPIENMVKIVYQTGRILGGNPISNQTPWVLTAWRAQLNGSIKVMAIKGDTTSLERLFNMQWAIFLAPEDKFTSVMWAFWFNQPATAQFLMRQVGDPSQLTPNLQDLYRILGYWCSLSAGSSRDNIRNNIKGQRLSSFNSGYFFNEFPQASRLLDRLIEDNQDAVLDAMENQLTFSLPSQ
ncbi:hypothetical protein H4R33_004456 [Dimargaris cristalligena]|nr:hypothetical protein H4R33_004456 [Dimargaris cristalligena]